MHDKSKRNDVTSKNDDIDALKDIITTAGKLENDSR